jgi:outer membrane receptor protein involved in Fe transport
LAHLVRISFVLVFAAAAARAAAPDVKPALDEVVITGTYRPASQIDVPASVSVLDATILKEAGQEHFEDVLALVPNLNWAGDTSRPRYFQIRGIGELEQYQGAPNPSVGVLIDDIDFSGLGSALTLFDVDHIEVLRGPQGLRYGATRSAVSFMHKARSLRIQWADTLSWVQATTVNALTGPY